MQIFKHTIVIARTREDVFDFFTNWEKAPSWRQYVKSMTPEGSGPLKPGSRIRFVLDLMGEEISYSLTVIACERPSLWRHHTQEAHFKGYIEYKFDTEGTSTRVTFSCEAKPATLLGWLAVPQMWLTRNKSYREQLPALKRALEER